MLPLLFALAALGEPAATPVPGPPMAALELTIDHLWDGTPARPDEVVHLRLERDGDDYVLHVDAPFHDDPEPVVPVGPYWGLWNHEVVELFITGAGAPEPYLEVEVGPFGHHIVIELRGARKVTSSALPLDLTTNIAGGRWTAVARLPGDWIPEGPHHANAFTIHGVGEDRRYLAWSAVPGERADFHQIHLFPEVVLP